MPPWSQNRRKSLGYRCLFRKVVSVSSSNPRRTFICAVVEMPVCGLSQELVAICDELRHNANKVTKEYDNGQGSRMDEMDTMLKLTVSLINSRNE